jgi:hypothetical protein
VCLYSEDETVNPVSGHNGCLLYELHEHCTDTMPSLLNVNPLKTKRMCFI